MVLAHLSLCSRLFHVFVVSCALLAGLIWRHNPEPNMSPWSEMAHEIDIGGIGSSKFRWENSFQFQQPMGSWLVVEPTPLKNMKVNWDDYSQYMEKQKMFQSPPTRLLIATNHFIKRYYQPGFNWPISSEIHRSRSANPARSTSVSFDLRRFSEWHGGHQKATQPFSSWNDATTPSAASIQNIPTGIMIIMQSMLLARCCSGPEMDGQW